MAAQIAKDKNTLHSIRDVTVLYEEYFSSILKDLVEINQPNLLIVAGVIVFFRSVDRSNKETMRAIETAFGIPDDIFGGAAKHLHELELFDFYENEVVRVSDQVLATYLFYLCFFREKVADFGVLLEHFFPGFRSRFVDAINPILNAFDSQAVIDSMRPYVDHHWTRMEKAGNEEVLLLLIQTFWYVKRTDTLLHIRKRIEELPSEPIDPSNLDFKAVQDPQNPSLFGILSLFRFVEDNEFRTALELMLDYVLKQPGKLPHVLYLFTESLSFTHKDYLRCFSIQRAIIDVLWERACDGHNLFARLFLEVAKKYLHTHFHTSESMGNRTVTIIRFNIPNTPELLELRKEIWSKIFQIYNFQELQEQVLNALHSYIKARLEVSSTEIIKYDASMVLPFIERNLNPAVLSHCTIVQEYFGRLRHHRVDFDGAMQDRFKSEVWAVSKFVVLTEN